MKEPLSNLQLRLAVKAAKRAIEKSPHPDTFGTVSFDSFAMRGVRIALAHLENDLNNRSPDWHP